MAELSCPPEGGREGAGDQRKGGQTGTPTPDVGASLSVRDVGCEEQEKIWGSTPQKGQRGIGLVLSSHDGNGRS